MPIVPINFDAHAKTRIRPLSSFAFAAKTPVVPLYLSELSIFCHEVPVVFIADGEHLTPAALLGLHPEINLLIDGQGRWLAPHIPGVWRRNPFRLGRIEGSEEHKLALCLDDSSDQLNEIEGQPLFAEDGTPSPLLQGVMQMLSQFEQEAVAARTICAELRRLELIVPWPLEVEQPNGTKLKLSGIFRVEEANLRSLPAEELAKLRDIGGLAVIYAHLLSLSRINLLATLARRVSEHRGRQEAVRAGAVDLDRAFGIVEDDPFIF